MTLIHGEALEEMKKLEDKSVDLILTDPPYYISKTSGFTNTKIDKYKNHTIDFGNWDKGKKINYKQILNECYRVLKDGSSIILFYDIWKFETLSKLAEQVGFKQKRIGILLKTNPVPINSKLNYLSNSKEFFMSFVKKSKPTFHSEYDNAVYSFPIVQGKERTIHPTQKSLKFMQELIEKHSNKNETILDPFMGSGSTLVACKNTNRNGIGIELDKKYFDIAEKRIKTTPERMF